MLPATNRGLVGILPGELVGRVPGQLGGLPVQLVDVLLKRELLERQGRAVERVGLDDIGAGLEVGAVDLLDELGLRQDERFGAVLEPDRVPGEAAAPHVLLGQLVRVDQCPHRSVEDHDLPVEQFLEPVVRVRLAWY